MIGKFRFRGEDVVGDIRERYGYDGDLARIFAENSGPVIHKWHHYIPIYDRYFSKFRETPVRFLEIGVAKGGSLQMWRRYFGENAKIFGVDIDENCRQLDGQSAAVRIGSQDDPRFLSEVVAEMGGVDIVLDDGSHRMDHVRASLEILFPMLATPGLYMIEDLHTSFWPDWGGGLEAPGNLFHLLPAITQDMHIWAHGASAAVPAIAGDVGALHIHDSIILIEKQLQQRPTHSRVGTP